MYALLLHIVGLHTHKHTPDLFRILSIYFHSIIAFDQNINTYTAHTISRQRDLYDIINVSDV